MLSWWQLASLSYSNLLGEKVMSRGQCWSKTLNHLWGFTHEERPYMRQKLTTKNHLRIGQNCCHCPCNWLQDCQLEIHPAWCPSIYQAELCYYQELELNFVQNGWYKIILVFWDWTVKFSSKCIESTPAYFGHPINLLWSLHHNLINLISDTTFDFYIFLLPTGSIGSFSIWVFIRTESLSELIEALIRCENDGLECWHQPKHVTLDLLSHIMLESSSSQKHTRF